MYKTFSNNWKVLMTLQISLAASFYKIRPIYNDQTDSTCDYLLKHVMFSCSPVQWDKGCLLLYPFKRRAYIWTMATKVCCNKKKPNENQYFSFYWKTVTWTCLGQRSSVHSQSIQRKNEWSKKGILLMFFICYFIQEVSVSQNIFEAQVTPYDCLCWYYRCCFPLIPWVDLFCLG